MVMLDSARRRMAMPKLVAARPGHCGDACGKRSAQPGPWPGGCRRGRVAGGDEDVVGTAYIVLGGMQAWHGRLAEAWIRGLSQTPAPRSSCDPITERIITKSHVNRSARTRVSVPVMTPGRDDSPTWWGGLPMARVALDHELRGARNRADCKIIWLRSLWRAAADRAVAHTARN